MKPSDYEMRQLRIQDERLMKFKEKNFEYCGYDGSVGFFVWIIAISLPIIGLPLLILWLLFEWYMNLIRMTKIFLNQIILILMRFNYAKLILVMIFVLAVLFILANIFK